MAHFTQGATMSNENLIGTILSDQETPTFETVRVKLKTGQAVSPGTLITIPVSVNGSVVSLIGRIKSAYEHNPHESPEDINVRDTLGIERNYPLEEDSTTIYRLVEADLIEEIAGEEIRAPQTLSRSGTEVFVADPTEIVQALGLESDESAGLFIGKTASGTNTSIILKRETIQRHMFICGTTGSGKSYAMGVLAEELVKHRLPWGV
jgi:DNA helicase HerA-like ATPase